jgi:hypothetical protein
MSPEVTDIAAGRILNFGLFFSHMQPSLEFSTFRFFLLAFLPLPPLLFQELPGEFGTFYLLFFSPFGLAKIIVDCPIIESVLYPIPAFVDSLSCRFFFTFWIFVFSLWRCRRVSKVLGFEEFHNFLTVNCSIVESVSCPIPAFIDSLSCRYFTFWNYFLFCGGGIRVPKVFRV